VKPAALVKALGCHARFEVWERLRFLFHHEVGAKHVRVSFGKPKGRERGGRTSKGLNAMRVGLRLRPWAASQRDQPFEVEEASEGALQRQGRMSRGDVARSLGGARP
jgi:hypothetical protein